MLGANAENMLRQRDGGEREREKEEGNTCAGSVTT